MVGLDGEDVTGDYCGHDLEDNGFCCGEDAPYEFYFEEESEHNLKYYCIDALGNGDEENYDEEKFKVFGKMFEIVHLSRITPEVGGCERPYPLYNR